MMQKKIRKKKEILIVYNEAPVPTSGGNIRVYNLINSLRGKHKITLLILPKNKNDRDILTLKEEFSDVDIIVGKIFFMEMLKLPLKETIKWCWNRYFFLRIKKFLGCRDVLIKNHLQQNYCLQREIRHLLSQKDFDIVQVEHFYLSDSIRKLEFDGVKIMDLHNVHSAMMEHGRKRRNLEKDEILCANEFDGTIVCSAEEKKHASNLGFRNICIIPNFIDVKNYQFAKTNKANKLLFIGDLGYSPNREGVLWFIKKIKPFIHKNTRIDVVGKNPGFLAKFTDEQLRIHGFVDDISSFTCDSVFFCPIKTGGGTRIKLIVAAAQGMPIITTKKGVEGLMFQNNNDVLIADTPSEFISELKKLEDKTFSEKLRKNARKKVEELYSLETAGKEYLSAIERIAQNSRKYSAKKKSLKKGIILKIDRLEGIVGIVLKKVTPSLYLKLKKARNKKR